MKQRNAIKNDVGSWLENALKECQLFVFDFDGVMTDNRVLVAKDGKEYVVCNRADGLGVNILLGMGKRVVILSTEKNPVVTARAQKLGIEAIQGVTDKAAAMKVLQGKYCVAEKEICYVGNDVNDYDAMMCAALRLCPSDSHDDIRAIAHYTLPVAGGEGVVRYIATMLGAESSKKRTT